MNGFDHAVSLDIAQQITKAAQAYEEVIKTSNAPLDAFLNLAFIYWQSTDYGFNVAHQLDIEFIQHAGARYPTVLEEARARFGDLPVLLLWGRYFDYISMGDPAFIEEFRSQFESCEAIDVVVLHLYLQTGDPQFLPHVKQLMEQASALPTTKNRYVLSVLESALKQFGQQHRI